MGEAAIMAVGAIIARLPAERVGAGASAGTGAKLAQHADVHWVAKEQISSAVAAWPGVDTGAAGAGRQTAAVAPSSDTPTKKAATAASRSDSSESTPCSAGATCAVSGVGAEVDASVAGSSLLSSRTELSSSSHVVDILGSGGAFARVLGGEDANQQPGCGGIS